MSNAQFFIQLNIKSTSGVKQKYCCVFSTRLASAAPANRLWCYLVRQELVQDIFIRAVFGKRRSLSTILESNQSAVDGVHRGTGEDKGSDSGTTSLPEPVRIIHKEQDSISAFCLNQVSTLFLDSCFTYNNICYIF